MNLAQYAAVISALLVLRIWEPEVVEGAKYRLYRKARGIVEHDRTLANWKEAFV